jgi:hypothetical protein
MAIAATLTQAEPHPFGYHKGNPIGESLDVDGYFRRTIVAREEILLAARARRLLFTCMTELTRQFFPEAISNWVESRGIQMTAHMRKLCGRDRVLLVY